MRVHAGFRVKKVEKNTGFLYIFRQIFNASILHFFISYHSLTLNKKSGRFFANSPSTSPFISLSHHDEEKWKSEGLKISRKMSRQSKKKASSAAGTRKRLLRACVAAMRLRKTSYKQ